MDQIAPVAAKLRDHRLRTTCFQVLFVGVYCVGQAGDSATAATTAGKLVPVCLEGLRDCAVEVQTAALKLLGALLGTAATGDGLGEAECHAALSELRQLVTAEETADEVRALASQLQATVLPSYS